MKKILFTLAIYLLTSSSAFASGKLSLTGNYYTLDKRPLPAVGFNTYEDTGLGFALDTYLGMGIAPRHNYPDVYWWVARADIAIPVTEDVTISAGATFRLSDQEWIGVEDESNVHVKAVIKLWE